MRIIVRKLFPQPFRGSQPTDSPHEIVIRRKKFMRPHAQQRHEHPDAPMQAAPEHGISITLGTNVEMGAKFLLERDHAETGGEIWAHFRQQFRRESSPPPPK